MARTPKRPESLSLGQRQEFVYGFENHGFEHFLMHRSSPGSFQERHGLIPKDVFDAWMTFRDAHVELCKILIAHKSYSTDDLPEPEERD